MFYPGYDNIEALSRKERIQAFKETIVKLINLETIQIQELMSVIELAEEDEQYELAEAIRQIVQLNRPRPQMK